MEEGVKKVGGEGMKKGRGKEGKRERGKIGPSSPCFQGEKESTF